MNADTARRLVNESGSELPGFDTVMARLYEEIRENAEGGMTWMEARVGEDIANDVIGELETQGYEVTYNLSRDNLVISWGDSLRDLSRFNKYVDAKIIYEVETAHFAIEPHDFILLSSVGQPKGITATWEFGDTRIACDFRGQEYNQILIETEDAVHLLDDILEPF